MSEKLTGSFYFKKTYDFNLLGEFANNDPSNKLLTVECANKIEKTDGFRGTYISVWHDTETHTAKLTIDLKFNDSNTIYTLKWFNDIRKEVVFEGEGFLLDENTLIGFYQGIR